MIEFLQHEYQDAGAGLGRVLRDGTRQVTKKEVKARHPFVKDDLAEFVRAHPEVLEHYKDLKGAQGPLDQNELEQGFDERAFAAALRAQLSNVPPGNDAASRYHSFATGVCTFLFYPSLICPVKEHEIHQGRKRIDIKFTNAGERGFFHRMIASPQTRAISVFVECKNYTKELANPELDQLSGRFGHQRGFFGMVLCRQMDDRARIIERCRDAANDGRGFMLVLEDQDLNALLQLVEDGHRDGINNFLQRRFDEITH
jgi:hypothetical protein